MASDWKLRGILRRDYRHGKVDESDYEDVRHRRSRKGRKCSKNKAGHEFTVRIKQNEYTYADGHKSWWIIDSCKHCGKHGSWSYYATPAPRR